MNTLKPFFQDQLTEAGCDEAGRGCLAGPVYAAAVILPKDFHHPLLTDSKQLSEKERNLLRKEIETAAIDFAVAALDHERIDEVNILQASVAAMHAALDKLTVDIGFIIIDGNYFKSYRQLPHRTIIKGDALYYSIAAASVLAKTYRDEYMLTMHESYPVYNWAQNKGYGTAAHRSAIIRYGYCPLHRKSFQLKELQQNLF